MVASATAMQIIKLPLQCCVSSSQSSFSSGQWNYGVCPPIVFRSSGISGEVGYDRWVIQRKNRRFGSLIAQQEKGDSTEIRVPVPLTLEQEEKEKQNRDAEEEEDEEGEADPEAVKYVSEIKRVLELLRRNRDMMFSEVKLTIMIEDPRELERRRLLGIEDADAPSREDLAEALEQVNEGKIPKDRTTLQMLYEEMIQWPNLEVEVTKKQRGKSLYAKSTDTGIDPKEAAKRLKVDWDSAAAIEEVDDDDDSDIVPKAVGYGALYLVSAFPVIIETNKVAGRANHDEMQPTKRAVHAYALWRNREEKTMAAAVLMPTFSFRDESIQEPKKKVLVKQTSMIHSEREISMDPKSIKSLSFSGSMRRNDSFEMVLLPAMSPPRELDSPMPLPLQPVRTKFVSRSLPNSTATSPKQRSGLMRSLKSKEQNSTATSPKQRSGQMRSLKSKEQNSTATSPKQRSGQMRSLKSKEQDSSLHRRSKSLGASSKKLSLKSSAIRNSFFIKTESNKNINNNNTLEDGFKCNALCLYLPGFGKGKPVRSSRKEDSSSFTRTTTMTTSSSSSITVSRTISVRETTTTTTVISARASMEKFECSSYASESAGDEGGGHLFNLPSELIKSGSGENDQDDPVSTAFLFDKEPIEKEIKGVLKTSGSKNGKSMESSLRHVRFSTSSPVSYPTSPTSPTPPSISPRLLEASKNFNAFLEAQAV